MVDDGIYYFSSYRAECDVMSWEKIIKAPPPRPPSNTDIPTVSKYSSPRWLNVTSKGEHDRYDRTVGPKVTDIKINPLYPVDAFIVDAKTFKRYEDLSSMTSEDINRQLAVDVGEDKLTFNKIILLSEGYLASEVDKVYEQMMDDIYDDFEVWNAYGGWKMFEKKYHSHANPTLHTLGFSTRPRFGGEIYILAADVNEWLAKAQTLLNSKYPAMNARIRTTVTNLVNGLNQLEGKPIGYIDI